MQRPLQRRLLMLLQKNATVTVCHSRTRDIAGEVRSADIVLEGLEFHDLRTAARLETTDNIDVTGIEIHHVREGINLTDLRKAGLIEGDSLHRIILLQPQRLAEVAEGDC